MLDLLFETRKLEVESCNTPMVSGLQRLKDGEPFEDPKRYKRLVGKLNYLTITCPNIAYLVSIVSQFMTSSGCGTTNSMIPYGCTWM